MITEYKNIAEIYQNFRYPLFKRRVIVTEGVAKSMGMWQSLKEYIRTSTDKRKQDNIAAVQNFIDALRTEVGSKASDVATRILYEKLTNGKKLHHRDVWYVLDSVSKVQNIEPTREQTHEPTQARKDAARTEERTHKLTKARKDAGQTEESTHKLTKAAHDVGRTDERTQEPTKAAQDAGRTDERTQEPTEVGQDAEALTSDTPKLTFLTQEKYRLNFAKVLQNKAAITFIKEHYMSTDEVVSIVEIADLLFDDFSCFDGYFSLNEADRKQHKFDTLINLAVSGMAKLPAVTDSVYVGPMQLEKGDYARYERGTKFAVKSFYARGIARPQDLPKRAGAWQRITSTTAKDISFFSPDREAIMQFIFPPGCSFTATMHTQLEAATLFYLTESTPIPVRATDNANSPANVVDEKAMSEPGKTYEGANKSSVVSDNTQI